MAIFAPMQTDQEATSPLKESRRSFDVPVFIRKLMWILEKLHWKLARKFAIRLFFTPIKFPVPKREVSVRERARTTEIPLGDRKARLFEWGHGDRRVIMMHGWSGRATQFFRIIEGLTAEGYHVYSVEAPAHGESGYKQTDMLEFVKAIEWTVNQFGPFEAAIGHSLGGVALFNAHDRLNGAFGKLVIIGSPANIRNVVLDFCEVVNASDRVANGIIASIENSFSLKTEDVSTDTLAGKWNPPGLIFHDETDADVSVANARSLARLWTNAQLHISSGLGHRRILSDPGVLKSILQFLES